MWLVICNFGLRFLSPNPLLSTGCLAIWRKCALSFEMPSARKRVPTFRDGEATIEIEFALFGGGGIGCREEIVQKRLFLLGIATTINVESAI